MENYSIAKVNEFMKARRYDEAKEYIDRYFFKCVDPASIFFYLPNEKKFVIYTDSDVRKYLITKNMTATVNTIVDDKVVKKNVNLMDHVLESDRLCIPSFDPTQGHTYEINGQTYLNTFRGFKHEYKPYDEFSQETKAKVDKILKHIYEVWTNENEENFKYVMNFLSWVISGHKVTS